MNVTAQQMRETVDCRIPLLMRIMAKLIRPRLCLTIENGSGQPTQIACRFISASGAATPDIVRTVAAGKPTLLALHLPAYASVLRIEGAGLNGLRLSLRPMATKFAAKVLDVRPLIPPSRAGLTQYIGGIIELALGLWHGQNDRTLVDYDAVWLAHHLRERERRPPPDDPPVAVLDYQQLDADQLLSLKETHVLLRDQRDRLAPKAAALLHQALRPNPSARLIYGDHAAIDENGQLINLVLKPAWNPLFQYDSAYIGRAALVEKATLAAALRNAPVGETLERLIWRICAGLSINQVVHVPAITHYCGDTEAMLSPPTMPATEEPFVSIVIPTRDRRDILEKAVEAVTRADYRNTEIIIIDNGSVDPSTLDYLAELHKSGTAQVIRDDAPFNFSRLMNRGFAACRGEFLMSMNNDIEMIKPDWLTELVQVARDPRIGIVGCKLLFPDGRIQHAGFLCGPSHCHWYRLGSPDTPGLNNQLLHRHNVTAVTGAVILVSRQAWNAAGPFDEDAFPITNNDIDLCLAVRAKKYLVAYTPHAVLIHHESVSRGPDLSLTKLRRAAREQAAFDARWRGFDTDAIMLSPHYIATEWPYLPPPWRLWWRAHITSRFSRK